MRIGITFNLKDSESDAHLPDDWQEEFDAPETVQAIATALRSLGHEVVLLGDGRSLVEQLLCDPPDLVFNFAEGEGVSRCREARVPALLEMLGIPYTGSDPLCLAATLDKDVARRLVASHGVNVAPGFLAPLTCSTESFNSPTLTSFARRITFAADELNEGIPSDSKFAEMNDSLRSIAECNSWLQELLRAYEVAFPVVVKPAWEGSSKGIRQTSLVHDFAGLQRAVAEIHQVYRQPALVEEYVAGEELTVGILGNDPPRILGILHVIPNEPGDYFLYSLEVKRDYRRRVRYESPPRLPREVIVRVEQAALRAYHALGCRDVCRLDFRVRQGTPYFLEANPLPGLNPNDSDLVILARLQGWSYLDLIRTILDSALKRISRTPDSIRPRRSPATLKSTHHNSGG
ncbi:MAG: D-alanine--D-alanine ligase [Gemmatales bacterium]|nr:D-alanine--D-alanine ligase [Gemmatales bacterium]MDW8174305.1 D-alanine--D-alanine ligase [Gemmatales bacterium]